MPISPNWWIELFLTDFCLSIIANGGVLMPLIIIVNWSISPFSSTICVVAGLAFFVQLNDLYILIDEFR